MRRSAPVQSRGIVVKHVIAAATLLGWLVLGLAACGDNGNTPPQPDTATDAPPYVDPAFLTIDHATNPFGSVLVDQSSAPATFRITNTGDEPSGVPTVTLGGPDASAFMATNTCTSALVAGGICTVTVTFTPTSAGAKTATLSVSAAPGGTVMAALTGTGLAPGALTLTVTPSALGSVVVGETGPTTALVTVMNDGGAATGPLALQPAGADPVDFTTTDDTCSTQTLAPNASCTFRIALAPRSAGPKSSEVRISATPGGSLDAAVTGTGLAPARLVATPLHRGFGTVVTNVTSSTGMITVTNTGDVASSALGVTVSGADAAMFTTLGTSTCTGTLGAGTSCQVHVAFTPTATGAKQALLTVSGAGTASATLAGTGIAAGQLSIAPTAHAFGNVNVDATSSTRELTITNGSGAPTGLLSAALIGANASGLQVVAGTDECTGVSLQPGEACTISVAFAPTRHGFANAELVVAGAPGGTVATSLTGVGIGPALLAITPPSRNFGGVATGDVSAPLVFTVTNVGGQASSAPTVAFGGTGAGQFQLGSSTCTIALAPGGVCTVAVNFAPTAPGPANATLEVSATTGGTASSALSGEGLVAGSLVFVPPVVQFAPLAVGETAEHTLTLVNTGAVDAGQVFVSLDSANYLLVGTTCTNLAANASCTVTVRFAPTTVGTGIGAVTANSPVTGTSTAALHGTISPRLEVIAINGGPVTSPHDVGQAIVNNTTAHDALITVRNNTATAQPLSLTETFNGQYQVISNTCDATDMIASHGTCTVGVRFAPTTTGTKTGSLTFAIGTGFTNQATQALTGTAIESLVITPLGGTAFGAVPLNTQSSVLRFRVTNPAGSVTTGALSTTLTGASLTIVANTCTGQALVAAATCDIDVRFAPTVAANVTGMLGVSATPGGAPSVALTANGIEPIGAAPTAITLTPGTVTEGSPAGTSAGTLASVDADVGQTYTYVLVGGTGSDDNSAFTLAGTEVRTNGVFDYETKASYSIRVRTTDSGGFTFEQAIAIEVLNVDELPTAVDDAATVAEDSGATSIDVRANDTDIDAGPKTIASVTQPANGQVAITGGGNDLTYQPNANFAGTDTFTYTLNGGSLATVTVTVTPVDDAPVAVNDSATVVEDSGTTAIDVRANDTDIDGGTKTITGITQPPTGQGTVVITGGGTGISYTTSSNYAGTTSFTYTLNGGSTATVTVTITAVDDPATATNDAYTVAEDSTATTLDVLANDTDVDGGTPIAIQSVTQPANGTVVMVGTTAVTFTPAANFAGTTTFTYTLGGGSTATVSVTVTAVDDAPVAVDDAATVTEDAGATAIPVLTNDTDTDGGTKRIDAVTQPAHGTVVITGGGSGITYAPAANYCNVPPGTALDTFTYTLNGNDSATVTISVTCVNDAPSALALSSSTIAENAAGGTAIGTFTSTDVDSTAFTYTLVAGTGSTNNGSFTIVGNELRSTAAFNFEATPTLAIRVRTDADGGTLEQAFVVTVTNANEAPTDFTPASSTLAENQAIGATVATLGGVDPDAGDTFTYSLVSGAGSTDNAQFSIAGNVLRVAVVQDYEASSNKQRTVRIQVTDASGLTFARAHVIDITNVDEAPGSIALTGTTFPETAAAGALVGTLSATDPEGGALTYSLVAGTGSADNSKFAIVGTQLQTAATYDFEAQSSFQVRIRVTDATSLSSEQTFTLTATDVNEAPVDGDEVMPAQAHVGLAVSAPGLLANATDPDAGNTVTAVAATNAFTTLNGRITIAADGSFTYRPPAGVRNTVDSYTYTVADPSGATNTSTLTINIDGNAIWFVDLARPTNGSGTLAAPANALPSGSFNGAGVVFVYTSDTSIATGIPTGVFTLDAGQSLLGEGVTGPAGATINTYLGYTTYPGSAALPTVNGPRHTVAMRVHVAATDAEIRDLDIGGLSATNFGTLTVNNVAIKNVTTTSPFSSPLNLSGGTAAITLDRLQGSSQLGIQLSAVDGNISIASGTFTTTSSGYVIDVAGGGVALTHAGTLAASSGSGMRFTNSTGAFTFANVNLTEGGIWAANASGKITVTNGSTTNGGLTVTGATGGIDFTGPMSMSWNSGMFYMDNVTGTAPINVVGNVTYNAPAGSTAMLIRNITAPVRFDGASKQLNADVQLDNASDVRFRNGGLVLQNAGLTSVAGGMLEISGANNTITANERPLAITNTTIAPAGVTFANVSCTTTNNALWLNGTSGGPIAIQNGACSGSTSYAASLNNVSNGVTVGMSLSNGVSISNSANTISFTKPITSTSLGIELSASPTANIAFSGGLDIQAQVPFRANNAGTLAVTGTTNRLVSTGAIVGALSVVNTTIALAGLTFRSLSSPALSIVLSGVGTQGGLTVTGTGTPTTGGSVRDVQIDGGANHALAYMNIDGDNGIGAGVTVTNAQGFTLQNSTVDGFTGIAVTNSSRIRLLSSSVTATWEAITFDGVTGLAGATQNEITNTSATAQGGSAFRINNTRSTNAPSVPANFAAGVTARPSKDTLVVSGTSSFTTATTSLNTVEIIGGDTSNHRVQLTATFTGGRGVRIAHPSNTGVLDIELSGSSITGATARGVDLAGARSGLMFDIRNNTIATAAGAGGIYTESFTGTPRGFITTNTIIGAGGGTTAGIQVNGSLIVSMANTGSNGAFVLGNSISGFNNAVWLVNPFEIHAQIMGLSGNGAAAGLNLAAADGLICVNLGSNNFTSSGGSAYSIFQNAAGILTLQAFFGDGTSATAIRNFIWSTNGANPTVNFSGQLHAQNGACTLP